MLKISLMGSTRGLLVLASKMPLSTGKSNHIIGVNFAIVGGISLALMGKNEKPEKERDISSEVSYLLTLQSALITDVAFILGIPVERDINLINRRCKSEGLSFLMKTLPAFGKQFLLSLEQGQFQRDSAFHTRRSRALPEFLVGFTELVFDKKTGLLLDEPCYVAAWAVHQICSWLYKYDWPIKPEVTRAVLEQMIRTDMELPTSLNIGSSNPIKRDHILELARKLIGSVFEGEDPYDIVPRHGPGSTNEGTLPQPGKYWFRRFDGLLDSHYPQRDFTSPSGSSAVDNYGAALVLWTPQMVLSDQDLYDRYRYSVDESLRTTKTITVNKDSRGPRVISAESKELMFIQQGQRRWLVRCIQQNALCQGHVNFEDQSVNRRLALLGSRDGNIATLDMKEASDRVSIALVGELFPENVFAALWSSRSIYTDVVLPETRDKQEASMTIRLNKFSPMGSAVCFPIEALCFWALSVAAVQGFMRTSVKESAELVFVYGDDVIVPPQCVEAVTECLELFGLKVNLQKSFWCGPFRESCGCDAFLGTDITPIRLKTRMPVDRWDANGLVGWTDTANLCVRAGLSNTAELLFNQVEKLLGPLPLGPAHAAILCRHTYKPYAEYLIPAKRVPICSSYIDGVGFRLIRMKPDSLRPDYHGYLLKGWAAEAPLQQFTDLEFYPEEHAWLHYVTLKAKGKHGVDTTRRAFSPRYVLTLRRRVVEIS